MAKSGLGVTDRLDASKKDESPKIWVTAVCRLKDGPPHYILSCKAKKGLRALQQDGLISYATAMAGNIEDVLMFMSEITQRLLR